LARAMRCAEAPHAGVKLASGRLYGRESQVDRLHAGKGRRPSPGPSLDRRPDARAEVVKKACSIRLRRSEVHELRRRG
jgi:hypothetical protein